MSYVLVVVLLLMVVGAYFSLRLNDLWTGLAFTALIAYCGFMLRYWSQLNALTSVW